MKILPYIDKYQNQVIALILYIQNYDTKVDLSLADQPDLLSIPEYYNATGGNFWVAVSDDDDVIGTIGLSVKENYGILKKFFVHEAFRGQGISTALYKELLNQCYKNELDGIILDTPSKSHRAHCFYEKKGFKKIKKSELPIAYHYVDRQSIVYQLKF